MFLFRSCTISCRTAIAAFALVTGLSAGTSGTANAQAPSAQSGSAPSVEEQTRGLLIQKLTQVYLNIAPNDSSKVPITLRLADLHTERARLDAMKELSSGCTVCNAGKDDRQKALSYYQEVLAKIPESSLGKVLSQVGHLYELIGQEKEAIAVYERVVTEQKAPEVIAEANLSLAEVYFKRRDFVKAQGYYSAVLANPNAGSRGLAAYRQAWCQFNEGSLEPAIEALVHILRSPDLLSRNAAAGSVVQVDAQFQEEVSRDLATFLSRRPVAIKDAELIFEVSPEASKVPNLIYLAGEVERLGQRPSAIELWRFAQGKQAKPQARLESHIRLAQLEMEQKLLIEAGRDFEMALSLWSQVSGCGDADCKELKVRLRKFVIDWNRNEKKEPSDKLLAAYKNYLKVFANEDDMSLWAGKVAGDLKLYPEALDLYLAGARVANETAKEVKEASERLEAGLLGAIESAELSKDAKLLDRAYDSYLSLSRDRKKALEVQYQKARIIYDRADYAPAAEALRAVALLKDGGQSEIGQSEIKKQAADLSLDSLVFLKDDQRIELWSTEYATVFPQAAGEFTSIARKSILTQATQAADAAGLEKSWATLMRFDLATASAEEKQAFYKNKLILAEKTQKFRDARDAVESLLRLPNLPSVDQQYAWSRKAWLSELILDFDSALTATEKITGGDLPNGQKWLKLAMYAELAQKDPKPFYSQFLKESKDEDKSVAIAAQFVRDSKEPLKEIEKQRATLLKRPEMLAQITLEVFAQTGNIESVKKALAVSAVAATATGKTLSRVLFLEDFGKFKTRIAAHQLDGSTQKKLAQTLKGRVSMLDEVEKFATRAIESGDWTSQLVALDLLAKQNERFYQEVLALPVPAGLTGEDEQQYLMLLSQQAAPHQVRANDTSKKLEEFWANEKALTQIQEAVAAASGPLKKIQMSEVKALADAAPETKKAVFAAMGTTGDAKADPTSEMPSLTVLEGAKQAVRDEPMNRQKIETLLGLEKKLGRQVMVGYLEGRLQSLEPQATTSK